MHYEINCNSCLKRELSRRFSNSSSSSTTGVWGVDVGGKWAWEEKRARRERSKKCWLKHSEDLCHSLFHPRLNVTTVAPALPSSSPSVAPTINYALICKAAFVKRCPGADESGKCLRCVAMAPSYTLKGTLVFEDFGDVHEHQALHCTISYLKKQCGSTTGHAHGPTAGYSEFFAPAGTCSTIGSMFSDYQEAVPVADISTFQPHVRAALSRCVPLAAVDPLHFSMQVCTNCMGR
jgi:hypothetical protein